MSGCRNVAYSMPTPFDLSRRDFLSVGTAAVGAALLPRERTAARWMPARPRPTAAHLTWLRDELALFLHFGVNTFTDREWGDGSEDPRIFNPTRLDARQWARSARAAGFRSMILTAKHHDGFCLWPTATTQHSVASSPWKDGHGDVVRMFVDACRAEGLRPGLYCSPWDRNHPTYGDSARYNDVYVAQLTELLTGYGTLAEVWFDGANGEGPNGKRQVYDWPRVWALVRKLQPNAVMFSDAGPDVRWIGNERGAAGETNWSTIRPESVPFIGASGDDVIAALQHGHADGTVWRPGETDVSIRPGWFYHSAEDTRVKSTNDLVNIYLTSVGRNSKLLLNVPPTRDGLLHDIDVRRLSDMQTALQSMLGAEQHAQASRTAWRRVGARGGEVHVTFSRPEHLSVLDLGERIAEGQRIAAWHADVRSGGEWHEVARGTTIGYRAIRRLTPIEATELRVVVDDAVEQPLVVRVAAYRQ